jgi:hypothetical protein
MQFYANVTTPGCPGEFVNQSPKCSQTHFLVPTIRNIFPWKNGPKGFATSVFFLSDQIKQSHNSPKFAQSGLPALGPRGPIFVCVSVTRRYGVGGGEVFIDCALLKEKGLICK